MKTNSKKILSLLLCVVLVLGLFPAPISVSAEGGYADWNAVATAAQSGTDYNKTTKFPYEVDIFTAKGLAWVMAQTNAGDDFEKYTVKLTEDIDLRDAGVIGYSSTGNAMDNTVNAVNSWPGIGTNTAPFSGLFDGQGFTVSGVYINDSTNNRGLFGYISTVEDTGYDGGLVQNVCVTDSHIVGNSYVGGIVGYNLNAIVQNSYYSGSVKAISDYAGGIVGYNSGTVQNNYNMGNILEGNYVGGIVGGNANFVANNYNMGNVNGTEKVGAIVGATENTSTEENNYTLENAITTPNLNGYNGEEKSSDFMKTEEFKDLLNAGAIKLDHPNTKTWVTQDGGYPIFSQTSTLWYDVAMSAVDGFDYTLHPNGDVDVHTAAGLAWIAEQVNSGATNFFEKTVILTDDIDLTEAGVMGYNGDIDPATGKLANVREMNSWPAIGFYNYVVLAEQKNGYQSFSGIFDGQGHTVSGVYIDSSLNHKGLFGYVGHTSYATEGNVTYKFGAIRNVGVINSDITAKEYVGGLVGRSDSGITNCYNTGNVSSVSDVTDDIFLYIGGVVGYLDFNPIINSYNTGNVSGNYDVGGIVGLSMTAVINSYNTGNVSGNTNVGGIVGDAADAVKNSYNSGTVSGTTNVSGTIGNNASGLDENIYYLEDAVISGSGEEHGTAKTEAELKSREFVTELNDWVFANKNTTSGLFHWDNTPDMTYPTVRANGYKLTLTRSDGIPNTIIGFAGDTITLADESFPDKVLDSWTVTPDTVVITNNSFIMPNEDVSVTANYKDLIEQKLNFAQDEVKKTLGDDKFTNTLTGAKTAITYSSSNEDVATVDSVTGEVAIVSAGTAEILATAAKDDTYSETTASYLLTVDSVKALTFDDITDYVASFDGDFDELAKIYFNGVELKLKKIDVDTYELYGYPEGSSTIIGKAERGSIVITLYEDFLKTLPKGDYSLSVTFNGAPTEPVGTTVVSIPEGAPDVPQTGDDSNVALLVMTLFTSLIATAVVAKKRTVK